MITGGGKRKYRERYEKEREDYVITYMRQKIVRRKFGKIDSVA